MTVRIRSAQMFFDAKVGYDTHPTFTTDTDIVDKKYVDDIAAYGVSWKQPVAVLKMCSNADQGGNLPAMYGTGCAFVVNNWGMGTEYTDGVATVSPAQVHSDSYSFQNSDIGKWLTVLTSPNEPGNVWSWKITSIVDIGAGHYDALIDEGTRLFAADTGLHFVVNSYAGVDGDIVEADATLVFQIIVRNSGGDPPVGTRVLVSPSLTGGDFTGHENAFATFGAGGTPTFVAQSDGDAVLVNGDGSLYANTAWVYESAGGAGWTQIGASIVYTAGPGIAINGAAISVEKGAGLITLGSKDQLTVANPINVLVSQFKDYTLAQPPGSNNVDGDSFIVAANPAGAWSGFSQGNLVQFQPQPEQYSNGNPDPTNAASWVLIKAALSTGDFVATGNSTNLKVGLSQYTPYMWDGASFDGTASVGGDQIVVTGVNSNPTRVARDWLTRLQYVTGFGYLPVANFLPPSGYMGLKVGTGGLLYPNVSAQVQTMDLVGTANTEPTGQALVLGRSWVVGVDQGQAWGGFDTGDIVEWKGSWKRINTKNPTFRLFVTGANVNANDVFSYNPNKLTYMDFSGKWRFLTPNTGDTVGVINQDSWWAQNQYGWTGAAWVTMPHLKSNGGLAADAGGIYIDGLDNVFMPGAVYPGTPVSVPNTFIGDELYGTVDHGYWSIVTPFIKSDADLSNAGPPAESLIGASHVARNWDSLKTGTGTGTLTWDAGNSAWQLADSGSPFVAGDLDKYIKLDTTDNKGSFLITFVDPNGAYVWIKGAQGDHVAESNINWKESTYQDGAIYLYSAANTWTLIWESVEGFALSQYLTVKVADGGAAGSFNKKSRQLAICKGGASWDASNWEFIVPAAGWRVICNHGQDSVSYGDQYIYNTLSSWVRFPERGAGFANENQLNVQFTHEEKDNWSGTDDTWTITGKPNFPFIVTLNGAVCRKVAANPDINEYTYVDGSGSIVFWADLADTDVTAIYYFE